MTGTARRGKGVHRKVGFGGTGSKAGVVGQAGNGRGRPTIIRTHSNPDGNTRDDPET
jgi:hypothetical protein